MVLTSTETVIHTSTLMDMDMVMDTGMDTTGITRKPQTRRKREARRRNEA
jgi:hypothetical protein